MPKKHIFLQNGFSTLGDISLQNVIAHPAEFFLMFNNSNLSLQKGSNNKLNGLIEWVGPSKLLLQNVQLCLLGVLLQNAPVRGLFVTGNYKMPMYTYLYIT